MKSVSTRPKRIKQAERGSVLIVCLGLLVVMSIMATAFISAVVIRRNAESGNYFHGVARAAALSGKARAIYTLEKLQGETMTTLGGEWVTAFTFSSGNYAGSMWLHDGVVDPMPKEPASSPWSNKAQFFIIENPQYGADGHTTDYVTGYAVNIIDLSGRIYVNKNNDLNAGIVDQMGQVLARIMTVDKTSVDKGSAIANSPIVPNTANNIAALKGIYKKNDATDLAAGKSVTGILSYSWDQIKHNMEMNDGVAGDFSSTALMFMTPFAVTEPGLECQYLPWRINVMTAPRDLLDAYVWSISEFDGNSSDDQSYGIPNLDTLVATDGEDVDGFGVGALPDGSPFADGSSADRGVSTAAGTRIDYSTSGHTNDWRYDIAAALHRTLYRLRNRDGSINVNGTPIDYYTAMHLAATPDAALAKFQEALIRELDPDRDILRVYNKTFTPSTAGAETKWICSEPIYDAANNKACRLEKATNDFMKSIFGPRDGLFDNDSIGHGIYVYDWDKSQCGTPAAEHFPSGDSGNTHLNTLPFYSTAAEVVLWSDGGPGTSTNGIHAMQGGLRDSFSRYFNGTYDPKIVASNTSGATYNNAADAARTWTGEIGFFRSHVFRVVAVGVVCRLSGASPEEIIAQEGVEFVYARDLDNDPNTRDGRILYQKWFKPRVSVDH